MNEIEIFSNSQFGEIRAVEMNGEPWFCLADICKPLGLKSYDCKRRLKEKGMATINTPTAGGVQGMLYCNEGNLYRTIFQSKKPEAEAFTDWVTEEVLPSLRKTGTYSISVSAPTVPPSVSPSGLASLIRINRRVMLDMGCTANEVGQMARDVFKTWAIPVPEPLNRQIPGQFSIWEQGKLGEGVGA